MSFSHSIRCGQKQLRCGYTTGTCAALAAQGALSFLLEGKRPSLLSLTTPKGWEVTVEPYRCERVNSDQAYCSVLKDAGDDPDVTQGLEIGATVRLTEKPEISIDGGFGVGRVTKPGLDQPVGAAAINRVPRQMIENQIRELAALHGYDGGVSVEVTVPEGQVVGAHTFNGSLGIEGGISILGTTGIVEPMSQEALVATIELQLHRAVVEGTRQLVLIPGNYGKDFLDAAGGVKPGIAVVTCSNFIGDALDAAVGEGFREILYVAHLGKAVKLAGGIMNTHSRQADCRQEILCAHAACLGAGQDLCQALMAAVSTDACLELLDRALLRQPVMGSLLVAIQNHLDHRVGETCQAGAVVFSQVHGLLGVSSRAEAWWRSWRKEPGL